MAAGKPFDVLVSDIMMPGIDGVELAAEARRRQPGLGVVLMSGFAEPPLHRAAGAQGVKFLSKPFALGELVAEAPQCCLDPRDLDDVGADAVDHVPDRSPRRASVIRRFISRLVPVPQCERARNV
jgi:CheY-like chemotaxis protein